MTTSRSHRKTLFCLVILSATGVLAPSMSSFPAWQATAQSQVASADAPSSGNAEASLSSIGDLSRRIKLATLDIVNDVEQHKLAVLSSDPLIMNPPDNNAKDVDVWAKQQKELGPLLPPKKKWLDADIAHLNHFVTMLNDEFGSITFADEKKEAVNATWTEMNGVLTDINSHFKTLQDLGQGPSYDNLAIGKAALRIHDDAKKLDKPWKDTLKTMQSR